MMVPNLEIGFGDHLTTIAPSFELDYRFRSDWGVWSPYLGGGLGPIFYSFEHGGSNTDFGAYVQGGIMKGFEALKPFLQPGRTGREIYCWLDVRALDYARGIRRRESIQINRLLGLPNPS